MKIRYNEDAIEINREPTDLDRFVIDFVSVLDEIGIKYVIVSGYVSILFGRSRISEDIDVMIEKIGEDGFKNMWNAMNKNFDCINTKDCEEAYQRYLNKGYAVRFSEKGKVTPNVEMKFPKPEVEKWALENAKKVLLNGKRMMISPLELQIAFKLYLGGEKDIEDARHLYRMSKENLDEGLLQEFATKLKVNEQFNKYLRDSNESA